MNRRRFLQAGSTVVLGALGGCSNIEEPSFLKNTVTQTFEAPYEWRFYPSAENDVTGISVTDEQIFASATDLHAIDRKTGREQWRYTKSTRGNAPAVHKGQGLVFAQNEYGLTALSIESGDRQWRGPNLDHWFETAPVIHGDTVIFGDDKGKILAVDASTGNKVWERQATSGILGLTADDGVVYAIGYSGVLHALDAATGASQWSNSLGTAEMEVGDAPVVSGDTVYSVGANKEIRAFDRQSSEIRWKKSTRRDVTGLTLASGTLFATAAASQTGSLLALDPATGARRYSVPEINTSGGPTMGDETLYVGTRKPFNDEGPPARLYAIDPNDRKITATLDIPGDAVTEPTVAQGTIYMGVGHRTVAIAKDEFLS